MFKLQTLFYDSKHGALIFRDGEWRSLHPSCMGSFIQRGQDAESSLPIEFASNVSRDELCGILRAIRFRNEMYVWAILCCLLHNQRPRHAARDWQVDGGTLRGYLSSVRNLLMPVN